MALCRWWFDVFSSDIYFDSWNKPSRAAGIVAQVFQLWLMTTLWPFLDFSRSSFLERSFILFRAESICSRCVYDFWCEHLEPSAPPPLPIRHSSLADPPPSARADHPAWNIVSGLYTHRSKECPFLGHGQVQPSADRFDGNNSHTDRSNFHQAWKRKEGRKVWVKDIKS